MTWLSTIVAGWHGVPRPVSSVMVWAAIAMARFLAATNSSRIWDTDDRRAEIEKENKDAIRMGVGASRSLMTAALLAFYGTSGDDGAATSLRLAIGSSLPGAQGKTVADQNRIDRTTAPGCAISLQYRTWVGV